MIMIRIMIMIMIMVMIMIMIMIMIMVMVMIMIMIKIKITNIKIIVTKGFLKSIIYHMEVLMLFTILSHENTNLKALK